MGIKIPDEPPELSAGENYFVWQNGYEGAGCTAFFAFGICIKTGAEINAYYAAGGDCVNGNVLCVPPPVLNSRVLDILGPI